MGSDYLKERARREKKGWKDGLDRLKQPRLDDRTPPEPGRVIHLKSHPQCDLKVGEILVLQPQGETLIAFSGIAKVAEAAEAPETIRTAIEDSIGMATARISQVDRLTGMVDVIIDLGTYELKNKVA